MKKYLYLTLSVVFIFAACNKKPTQTSTTRYDILHASKWKLSSGTLSLKLGSGKDTTVNYLDYVPSCHLDDYIAFNSRTIGAVFNGSNRCSPADGDSTQFTWEFTNNYNNLSFYRGFSLVWSATTTVNPLHFDTLSTNPILVLDTLHGFLDTLPGFVRVIPILDSTWNMTFTRDSVPTFNIYNADVVDFSASSFTIKFTMYSSYPDTTGFHTGVSYLPDFITGGIDTVDLPVIRRPDTLKYKLTYTSF